MADSSLAPTLLGGLLALGGGIAGQWLSSRKADVRDRRAVEHEAHTWARDQRCRAYLDFMLCYRDLADDVVLARRARRPPAGPDQFSELLDRLAAVELVGSDEAALVAQALCAELNAYAAMPAPQPSPTHVDALRDAFQQAVRVDLGLLPGP